MKTKSPGKATNRRTDLFDFLRDGVFIAGENLEILYANKSFAKSTGYKKTGTSRVKFTLLFKNGLRKTGKLFLEELFKNGAAEKEIPFRSGKQIRHINLYCALRPESEHGGRMIFGTFRDVTLLHSAIELLSKRNSLLNLLNDVIKYTSRTTDIRNGIRYSIDKVCQYTQWDIGHAYLSSGGKLFSTGIWNSDLKKKYREFRYYTETETYITEIGMPHVCYARRKTLVKDLFKIKANFPFKRFANIKKSGLRSGAWIPILVDNRVEGVVEFFSDSIIKPDDEIMNAINNMCLELGNLKDRIESFETMKANEKLAALGRFSAGIAHEIRNPLANISALSQLILKNEESGTNKEHLKYIIENTSIANSIIKDLLGYASPEEPHTKKINTRRFLEGIVEKTRQRVQQDGIKIRSNIAEGLPALYLDEIKIENSLMNFISNAVEALHKDGRITIEALKKKKENFVTIYISDNGQGIPPENMDKIFEPFFTTKPTGTGLGMGLAQRVIKAHEGTLNIKSKLNAGTSVEIKLPLRKAGKNA